MIATPRFATTTFSLRAFLQILVFFPLAVKILVHFLIVTVGLFD